MASDDPVLDALASSGLLHDARRTVDGAVEGEVCVEGRTTTLRVTPGRRAGTKPVVAIPSETELGRIPHVETNGTVCYQSDEGLVLDRQRPGAVAAEAARLALDVLADGVAGRNHADFVDEWETYWGPLGGPTLALVTPVPETVSTLAVVERSERTRTKRDTLTWVDGYVARGESDIAAFNNGSPYGERHTTLGALHVPLAVGAVLVPPTRGALWTPTQARDAIRAHLAPDALADLDRQLRKRRPRKTETVFVSAPRPSGGRTVFGIRFTGVRDGHPLLPEGRASTARPIQVERWDSSYLVPRGGGEAGLTDCHVVLAGCGAVGGHLAFELARAGVGRLTLVDPQLLRPENTFRHALGREFWGVPKAAALATALRRHAPYLRVEPVVGHLSEALADGRVDLDAADLVVVAIGAPTVELDLNERLWASDSAPATLFAWLEPLGLGGHALLTRPGHGPGCYECLHTPPTDRADPLHNRAAFAAADQDFSRATGGCGSLHTPYASADALRTATLAARLATDALTGHEGGSPIRSWRGDPTAFLAAGFQTTGRASCSDADLEALRYAHHAPTCPVCSGTGRPDG